MIQLRWISSRSNWTAAAAFAASAFTLAAKQDDAPAAFHPAGELGGAVFLAGAAGHSDFIAPTLRRIETVVTLGSATTSVRSRLVLGDTTKRAPEFLLQIMTLTGIIVVCQIVRVGGYLAVWSLARRTF